MTIDKNTFENLIKQLTSIEVSLEWDGDEGRAEVQEEIETSDFFLNIGLNVSESGTTDSGDYMTPPSFSSNGIEVEITSLKAFKNESEEEIQFTEEQDALLCKEIISLTTTIS